jgi:hypothetical protein
MLTSTSTEYESPTLVEKQDNERSGVSKADMQLAIEKERIANILDYTICKIELVVSLVTFRQ